MSFTHSRMRATFAVVALALASAGCETATLPQAGSEAVSRNLSGTVDEGTVDEGTVDEGTVDEGTVDEGTVDEGTADEGWAEDGWAEEGWAEVESWTASDTAAVSDSDTIQYLALAYDTGESEMIRADAAGPTVSGGTRGGKVTFPDGKEVSWAYSRYNLSPKMGPDGIVYWHLVITQRDGTVHHYIWSVGRFRHFTKPAKQASVSGATTS